MINRILRIVKFYLFKIKWKNVNKHNYTFPGNYIDINKVSIGNYTYGKINALTSNNPDERLIIGHYCSIASTAKFMLSGEHDKNLLSTYPFKQKFHINNEVETISRGPIIVHDDVWIAEDALVLSGVEIGQGAIIAAGSVITKNVPPYAIVGGVPGKVISYRFNEDIIRKLLKIDYENLKKDDVIKNIDLIYSNVDKDLEIELLPQKIKC